MTLYPVYHPRFAYAMKKRLRRRCFFSIMKPKCEVIMEQYLFEGNISVKAAIMGGMREVSEVIVDERKHDRDTLWIVHRALERNIPIRRCPREVIDQIAQGHTHGGLLCTCKERRYQTLAQCDLGEECFLALVEGVEDPFNFAAILRTLYASGCQGVLTRKRSWQQAAAVIAKTSAGASEYLPWVCYEDANEVVQELQARQIPLLCAERKDAVSLYAYSFPKRLCIAIGGEMRGLSKAIKQASAQNIYIPYGRDVRNALSAVSATAVISFEILRQRQLVKS